MSKLAKLEPRTVRRLNWGCGGGGEPGWINSDIKDGPRIDLPCDIRRGLPLDDNSIDYAVSVHALQEVPYPDLVPTLAELHRVLRPDGVLRLVLPDLDKGIDAYLLRERDYFLVPDDDARTLGGKLIVQLLWYGYSRTLFTADFTQELLEKAGFSEIMHCQYRNTHSCFPEIIALDNRERESLFVEAFKSSSHGAA